MSPHVVELGRLLAVGLAGATLLWSYLDVGRLAERLPVFPVRGHAFRAAPVPRAAAAEPDPIRGSGTVDDPFRVPFSRLAFPAYDPPELRPDPRPLAPQDFPGEVRRLAGHVVEVEGYQIGVDFQEGRILSFLLARYPSGCCFGAVPVQDEWIDVTLAEDDAGRALSPSYDRVRVRGRLDVGELQDARGTVQSLYRIAGAAAEPAAGGG